MSSVALVAADDTPQGSVVPLRPNDEPAHIKLRLAERIVRAQARDFGIEAFEVEDSGPSLTDGEAAEALASGDTSFVAQLAEAASPQDDVPHDVIPHGTEVSDQDELIALAEALAAALSNGIAAEPAHEPDELHALSIEAEAEPEREADTAAAEPELDDALAADTYDDPILAIEATVPQEEAPAHDAQETGDIPLLEGLAEARAVAAAAELVTLLAEQRTLLDTMTRFCAEPATDLAPHEPLPVSMQQQPMPSFEDAGLPATIAAPIAAPLPLVTMPHEDDEDRPPIIIERAHAEQQAGGTGFNEAYVEAPSRLPGFAFGFTVAMTIGAVLYYMRLPV